MGLSRKAKDKLIDYRKERGFKQMLQNYEAYIQCTMPLSEGFQTFTSDDEKPELDLE